MFLSTKYKRDIISYLILIPVWKSTYLWQSKKYRLQRTCSKWGCSCPRFRPRYCPDYFDRRHHCYETCLNLKKDHHYRYQFAAHLQDSIGDLKIGGGSRHPDSKVIEGRTNSELDSRPQALGKADSHQRKRITIIEFVGDSIEDFLQLLQHLR